MNRESRAGLFMEMATPIVVMMEHALGVSEGSPLASVIASRVTLRCNCLAHNRFQINLGSLLGAVVGVGICWPIYECASRLDPTIQMICCVALVVFDFLEVAQLRNSGLSL